METKEIVILCIYSFIVIQSTYYNHKMIEALKTVNNKRRLNRTLATENVYIGIYTFLSLFGIVIFYFNFSSIAYFIYLIETFIFLFSFSSLKKNILKKINQKEKSCAC